MCRTDDGKRGSARDDGDVPGDSGHGDGIGVRDGVNGRRLGNVQSCCYRSCLGEEGGLTGIGRRGEG